MFALLLVTLAQAAEPRWVGFEIVGQKTLTREQLAAEIPIAINSPYVADLPAWQAACATILTKFDLAAAKCGSVTFLDQGSYFVLDVVEKGDEQRLVYRAAGVADVKLEAPEIVAWYDRLYARRSDMFSRGQASREYGADGFLDFEDPEMHDCALKLKDLVPARRDRLHRILTEGRDADERARAANLLNWAGDPAADVVVAGRLSDDPDVIVRNNLSRFALAFIGRVKDRDARAELVRSYAIELERPSHADRNKALYALNEMVKAYPEDAPLVAAQTKPILQRLARRSVLVNVRGAALELLGRL